MQRTDRLFEIIQILRSAAGTPMTASQIAARMEVSARTIYRHMATLQSMRVPVEGEAGIGYVLRPGYDLPPLNFDQSEQEALIIGMGMLARTGDCELQQAARRILDKIETAGDMTHSLSVSNWGIPADSCGTGTSLRAAIRAEEELEITYVSLSQEHSIRKVWPLELTYYVEVAVLSAWCHLRQGFRAFRVDRINRHHRTGHRFTGQGAALRQQMQQERSSR